MNKNTDDKKLIEAYRRNRKALIQLLKDSAGPSGRSLRTLADAVQAACKYYGYASSLSFTNLGDRDLSAFEKEHFVLSDTIASNLACAFARYAPAPWAKDDPDAALRQVYIYCLTGHPEPINGADLGALDKLPTTIQLERIRPVRPESQTQIERIAAELRAATMPALVRFLIAIAENLEEVQQQPVEPEEPPCNDRCILVSYLRLGSKLGTEITDDDRESMAEATGIPLPRVRRLLCGDQWSPAEAAAIDTYVNAPGFTLGILAAAADARANADNQPESVGQRKSPPVL